MSWNLKKVFIFNFLPFSKILGELKIFEIFSKFQKLLKMPTFIENFLKYTESLIFYRK